MKKLIFILLAFVTLQSLYAQEAAKGLSEEGYKHWTKAIVRMEKIKQDNDYLLVIEEFSKVMETDPNYPDLYFNMGKIYTKIGEIKNELSYFEKAKECYDKYLALNPSEKMLIIKELARIEVEIDDLMKPILLQQEQQRQLEERQRNSVFSEFKELGLIVMNRRLGAATWFEAKSKCAELNIENFNDWYLPSKDELLMVFATKNKDFYKRLKVGWYWSSTEINDKKAYNVWYDSGWALDAIKSKSNKRVNCLCVRKIKQ